MWTRPHLLCPWDSVSFPSAFTSCLISVMSVRLCVFVDDGSRVDTWIWGTGALPEESCNSSWQCDFLSFFLSFSIDYTKKKITLFPMGLSSTTIIIPLMKSGNPYDEGPSPPFSPLSLPQPQFYCLSTFLYRWLSDLIGCCFCFAIWISCHVIGFALAWSIFSTFTWLFPCSLDTLEGCAITETLCECVLCVFMMEIYESCFLLVSEGTGCRGNDA